MTALPALVFDFDGTLIESAPEIAHCLNELLTANGRREVTLTEVEGMIGNGVSKLVERGFLATGGIPDDLREQTARYVDLYNNAPVGKTPLYEGVLETLELLRGAGYRMAVCTNKLQRATVKILDGMNLSRFFAVVAGGDTFPVRKPDPGHLMGVLDQLGVTREGAIMIGDSVNDIGCARAAGVRSVAVTYGYSSVPHAELGADVLIDRFADLPDALARIA
jgi:phosphoglycolate phosphatase